MTVLQSYHQTAMGNNECYLKNDTKYNVEIHDYDGKRILYPDTTQFNWLVQGPHYITLTMKFQRSDWKDQTISLYGSDYNNETKLMSRLFMLPPKTPSPSPPPPPIRYSPPPSPSPSPPPIRYSPPSPSPPPRAPPIHYSPPPSPSPPRAPSTSQAPSPHDISIDPQPHTWSTPYSVGEVRGTTTTQVYHRHDYQNAARVANIKKSQEEKKAEERKKLLDIQREQWKWQRH